MPVLPAGGVVRGAEVTGLIEVATRPGGREVDVLDADGALVLRVTFAVPGEVVPDWQPDDDDILLVEDDGIRCRLRRGGGPRVHQLQLTVDSLRPDPVQLPYLGLALEPGPAYAAWSWSTDLDALVASLPRERANGGAALRLTQGFLRPVRDLPTFAGSESDERRTVFHLAPPHASLGAFKRHTVTLELSPMAADSAGALLPAWMPATMTAQDEPIELALPDLAVVPGDGVMASTWDTNVSLSGGPGHGQIAVHGPRGVGQLRVTWVPELATLLPALVAEVLTRRPARSSDAAGVVVAEAVARGLAPDVDRALDWLDQVDWLDRDSLLADATAGLVAVVEGEPRQWASAWRLLGRRLVGPGYGLTVLRLWLAGLGADQAPDVRAALERSTDDPDAALELAVLRGAAITTLDERLAGLMNQLGGPLPGASLSLSDGEAARAVAVLRLAPEAWERRSAASAVADKASGLLLADHAGVLDGGPPPASLDGLAWLLLGGLGA